MACRHVQKMRDAWMSVVGTSQRAMCQHRLHNRAGLCFVVCSHICDRQSLSSRDDASFKINNCSAGRLDVVLVELACELFVLLSLLDCIENV